MVRASCTHQPGISVDAVARLMTVHTMRLRNPTTRTACVLKVPFMGTQLSRARY
jgi:hypothetical protein